MNDKQRLLLFMSNEGFSFSKYAYSEEWFDVLQHIETAIGEIGLLRNFNLMALNVKSWEYMVAATFHFGSVFARQIVTKCGHNSISRCTRQRIEYQNACSTAQMEVEEREWELKSMWIGISKGREAEFNCLLFNRLGGWLWFVRFTIAVITIHFTVVTFGFVPFTFLIQTNWIQFLLWYRRYGSIANL